MLYCESDKKIYLKLAVDDLNRMADLLKQFTILSKIDGLVKILRRLTDAQANAIIKILDTQETVEPLPTNAFENMRYIAQDLLDTIDEILQSDKMQ